MASRFVALIGVMVFLMLGGGIISAQHSQSVRDAGDRTLVENEAWNPEEGSVTTLNHSNYETLVYGTQEEVDVYQGGSEYVADGNWTWYDGNGTVKAVNGTSLNTSESAKITYSYYQPTQEQALLVDLGTIPIRFGGELLMLLTFSLFVLVFVIVGRAA